MDLYRFDDAYLLRLRSADPATEQHFSQYFGRMLTLKLRNRLRSSGPLEDLKQETLLRVLKNMRSGAGIREAEKLGAYVNTTCNYVLLEHFREEKKMTSLEDEKHDPPDSKVNLDDSIAASETRKRVKETLDRLDKKDRDLLRALFIDERDKDQICRDFAVDRDYLRVLLYRAKQQFRNQYSS